MNKRTKDEVRTMVLKHFVDYRTFAAGHGFWEPLVAPGLKRRGQQFRHMWREIATGKFFDNNGHPAESAATVYRNTEGKPRLSRADLDDRSRFEYSGDSPDTCEWAWYPCPDHYGSRDEYDSAIAAIKRQDTSCAWIDGLVAHLDEILDAFLALDEVTASRIGCCHPRELDIMELATSIAFPGNSRNAIGLYQIPMSWGEVADCGPNVHAALHRAVAELHGVPLASVGY